ncbi:hypothetical protein T492DRAFT_988121 [Pavlovales sp. CCMP2436]|nr:hypothetical protein T492DRAFT_988121 [Pavlovales sp. CCMP2436]
MADSAREEQRSRALALLAKSLRRLPASGGAREECAFIKSALTLTEEGELRGALRDRLTVLKAQAREGAKPLGGGGAPSPKVAAADDDSDEDKRPPEPMRELLEAWRDGDFDRAPAELLDLGFWRELALGAGAAPSSLPPPPPPGSASESAWQVERARMRQALEREGYFVSLPTDANAELAAGTRAAGLAGGTPSGWAWGEAHASAVGALAVAAEALRAAGWPPVFVFMLDESWALAEVAWPVLAPCLTPPAGAVSSADAECELDSSVFCWIASRRPPTPAAAAADEAPGSNFGTPHRDFTALESEDMDGMTILSAWLPLTPVSSRNGAMSVLPREFDENFHKRFAYAHMRPALPEDGGVLKLRFDLAAARQLAPLPAGTLVGWCGNSIHWGGRCASAEPLARVALGFNFVRAGVRLQQGRAPLSRAALRARLSAQQRLSICAASLLIYSNWYELNSTILPATAVLASPSAPAAGKAPAAPQLPLAAPVPRPTTAGGMPVPVGVRADGQPLWLNDSARQALYAKYGDISHISGDPSDLDGKCTQQ